MAKRERSAFEYGVTPVPAGFLSLLVEEFGLSLDDEVLEIGCGEGSLARALAARVAHVDALDESPSQLESAKARGDSSKIQYIESRAQDFFPRRQYKLIISFEAFHLLEDKGTVLRQAMGALVPGGSMCVAWVEFFWERSLYQSFAPAFSHVGIDWGTSPNLAALDMRRLAAVADPGLEVAYGSSSVEVAERFSLDEITNYLLSVSKAQVLSSDRKARLRANMLRQFRENGIADPIEGQSRYVIHFLTPGLLI
jgi:trans-aconitate methyltransferase